MNACKDKINHKIQGYHELIRANIEQIHGLECETEHVKKDIESIKHEQIGHYRKLLKEGIDSRKDGLIWIIKVLWLLGVDARVEDFPSYMDSESIKYLLEYAKMDIKRSEMH